MAKNMMFKSAIFTLLSLASPGFGLQRKMTIDYTQYVNPFIGAEGPYPGLAYGGGDIFVGGAVPFGVAKVGIDTYEANLSLSTTNGGYTPKGKVTAISMTHESGTGGAPKYGVVPQMPLTTVDAPVNILDNTTYWQDRVGNDTATVGYFKTELESGVIVELSGARHSGIMQYTFPDDEKHVLVDVSHYLTNGFGSYNDQHYIGGKIQTSNGGKQYTGHGTYIGGFNEGAPYTVYFCGEFEIAPDEAKTFRARNVEPIRGFSTYANEPIPQEPIVGNASSTSQSSGPLNDRVGALFSWDGGGDDDSENVIRSRVGISFISTSKACQFKDDEIASWSLEDAVKLAKEEWNRDVFSKVQAVVPTTDDDDDDPSSTTANSNNRTNLVLLYSSLYFTHLMPSDRSGENPLWDSGEPYWDDFYTAWDIFRCTVSLYHLLQPEYYESMIRGLIDIWRYEGYMPDGRSGNYNGLVQGGSDADNILADAYVKGLRGSINWTDGYAAMVKNAEVAPYNTFSPIDDTGSVKEGRGALADWLELGYVSSDRSSRCVSRTVEYASNDFALAQVASGLVAAAAAAASQGDVEKYRNRSANWQNSWNPKAQSINTTTGESFTGFLAPRLSDGTWDSADTYNPALCGGCEWVDVSYEATPFEYSFVVPHDLETLISFMGGEDKFESRLDYVFLPNTSQQDLGANGVGISTIMNIGNEPDFATPYLYHYLNKQSKSVHRSRALARTFFKNEAYGVPGNSDAGALNSWLIWQMLGLYPVASQDVYLLGSPWFGEVNVTLGGGTTMTTAEEGGGAGGEEKKLRIRAHGLDEQGEAVYVQRVEVNGEQWDKNWLRHGDVMVEGGTIDFWLGKEMKGWETGEVPPSPGHVVL